MNDKKVETLYTAFNKEMEDLIGKVERHQKRLAEMREDLEWLEGAKASRLGGKQGERELEEWDVVDTR